jgi:hypothetical protein
VKRWFIAALLVAALPAAAADWREEFTPLLAGNFPLPRPQKAIYRFGWGKVPAAEATIDLSRHDGELQLDFGAKTIGAVRLVYRLDATHTARCDAATLRPIFLQQTERYRRETEKTKVDFSPEGAVRLGERVPPDQTLPRPKRFEFPQTLDLQTALLLVRSQALLAGDRYTLVVYPSRTPYLARIAVLGRESLPLDGKIRPAVKLQIFLQRIAKDMTLEPHTKFKNAYGWLSDDADRLLLKVQCEVFVGSVSLELQSVKFTGE